MKSPTTKPTKPSRPSGTRSRIKNAANTTTTPNSSPALSTPALRPLTYPPRVTVNITLAPEGARSDDLDDHPPATHPRNAIEAAIHDTIANTPTPSALPGTPLDRLAAPQPEGS